MELGGVTEVATVLGISKQRLAAIRVRPSFPQPEVRLAQGPVWDMDKVRRWAETSRQPRGRPHTLAARRRLGGRFELEGIPAAAGTFQRAIDLGAVASCSGSRVVAVRTIPAPSDEARKRSKRSLDRLMTSQHPHVIPVLACGINDDPPYYVTPLPLRQLRSACPFEGGGEAFVVGVLHQISAATRHLLRLEGVGFRIDSSTIVQTSSSAWCISDLLPHCDPPDAAQLSEQLRSVVNELSRVVCDPQGSLLSKSLDWLDNRLARRTKSLEPEALAALFAEDLDQMCDLLARGDGSGRSSDRGTWLVEAVRHGTCDCNLLRAAIAPLAADRSGLVHQESALLYESSARMLTWLEQAQIQALFETSPDLMRDAVEVWVGDLAEGIETDSERQLAVNFLARLLTVDDGALLRSAVIGLVTLGSRSRQWYAWAVLVNLLQGVCEPLRVSTVVDALKICEPIDVERALAGTDPHWLHPKVRELVTIADRAPSGVIDLSVASAPRRDTRVAVRL